MNKKGQAGRQLMGLWFFVLMAIVGAGIVAGVFVFFGEGYDSRGMDSDSFGYEVKECIMREGLSFSSDEDFFKICSFRKSVFEENNLRVKICVNSGDCIGERNPFLQVGSNFEVCGLDAKRSNRNFGRCSAREFVFEGKNFVILSVSNRRAGET